MEGPASTSPLVDTITGSTTKAAFNEITKSIYILDLQEGEAYIQSSRTAYLELETP